MAIQLNERDHLIFKYIEEHKVLLEKHISWFISVDHKPVLIRDRLRKLFYLDYLLCQRHRNTLPWWTTPTKPLIYVLSPMTRHLIGAADTDVDLSDDEVQRHFLEVANLRMLFLIDESTNLISEFEWKTINKSGVSVDAIACFVRNQATHKVGIINQPLIVKTPLTSSLAVHGTTTLENNSLSSPCRTLTNEDGNFMKELTIALSDDAIDMIWLISRDADHQLKLQHFIASADLDVKLKQRLAFATHYELYNSGMVKTRWQTFDQHPASIFVESLQEYEARANNQNLNSASA